MKAIASRIGLLALIGGAFFLLTTTAAMAMNEDLIGAVVKTDQGFALSTDSGEYLILGKRPAGLVGETVSAKGNVEKGALANTIRVDSYKVVARKDIVDPAVRTLGMKTR